MDARSKKMPVKQLPCKMSTAAGYYSQLKGSQRAFSNTYVGLKLDEWALWDLPSRKAECCYLEVVQC